MAHLLRGIPHKGGVGTLLPRLHEQRDTADLGRGLLVRHQKHRRTKQPQDGRFPHTHHTAGCRRVIEPNPSQGKPRRVIPDSSLSYGKGLSLSITHEQEKFAQHGGLEPLVSIKTVGIPPLEWPARR